MGRFTLRALITCCVISVLSVACQTSGQSIGDSVEAVRLGDASLQAAVEAKDLDQIMSHYAVDASLLPAASPIVEGWEAIRKEWSHILAIPEFDSSGEMTKIAASEDLAYTQGRYRATMNGPDGETVVEEGKWITVWRREANGSWKVIADIYNTDTLPPEHS